MGFGETFFTGGLPDWASAAGRASRSRQVRFANGFIAGLLYVYAVGLPTVVWGRRCAAGVGGGRNFGWSISGGSRGERLCPQPQRVGEERRGHREKNHSR